MTEQAIIPAFLRPNKTGRDLIPIFASPSIALKSFKVIIPKAPNAYTAATKMIWVWGNPIEVPKDSSKDDILNITEKLNVALNYYTNLADNYFGHK